LVHVDATSFFLIVLSAAVAAAAVAALPGWIAPPVVVLELLFGIAIGPHGFGWASTDEFSQFFSNLGLGMLFYFAGYEIDFERIRGAPLRLGAYGWLLSVVLAYAIGGILALLGVIDSLIYTGSAMATTAIGTLIPILRDGGALRTKFGTYLLGAGAVGEFGPILLVTLFLSTDHPLQEAAILIAFVLVAVGVAMFSMGAVWRGWSALEQNLESSNQLMVRITVVLIFGLVGLAGHLHLDILLGGFVAGMITRAALRGHEVAVFESKLTAVGFGFFVPFFFIFSGMDFDLQALGSAAAIAKLVMFFALFLVVRGAPALLLYRDALDRDQRRALAFYSATELPLVVAITTLALDAGHMKASTAAGLVGAAMLSTLVFPFIARALLPSSDRLPPSDQAAIGALDASP
jgi:Kef-type K+ transport system membrane component KefB